MRAFQGGSSDTGKQLFKFLGPPGPSDRLLHRLDLLSELVERSQHDTLAEEVHEWKQLVYGLWQWVPCRWLSGFDLILVHHICLPAGGFIAFLYFCA